MESTHTRNSQASATGRTLFGVFHLSGSQLSRMTCAKVPRESWASQCVKKAPHGAELCNHKKREREREIRPPGSLAGIYIALGQAAGQCCHWFWVLFLLRLCFFSKSLTFWGCGHQRARCSPQGKEAWPAVRLKGALSHTHRHPQTCSPTGLIPTRKQGFPDPLNPQPALMSRWRGGTLP